MPRGIGPKTGGLFLEELIGDIARRLLARDRSFKPGDLFLHQGDAFLQLLDRQERELLPDLVHDLLLRAVVVIVLGHTPSTRQANCACSTRRRSRNPSRSSRGSTSSQKNGNSSA